MILRRARPADATTIGAIHVAAWRATYAGLLPDGYLAGLSAARQARGYGALIQLGRPVFVAEVDGAVVGFVTAGPARRAGLGTGEVETLYVLDDWRDRGLGRRLMGAAAAELAAQGHESLHVWVLRDNPGRWFYARLGGREAASDTARVAGRDLPQLAYLWAPIAPLLPTVPDP